MQKIFNKKVFHRILLATKCLLIAIILGLCGCGQAKYDADDTGAVDNVSTDSEPGAEAMFDNSITRTLQVTRWIDTGIYTVGMARSQDSQEVVVPLKIRVEGKWYPFGQTKNEEGKRCQMVDCDPSEEGCLTRSNVAGIKANGKKLSFQLEGNKTNKGCFLDKGYGLYGLIVGQKFIDKAASDGIIVNPNASLEVASNPLGYEAFRVFHFADLERVSTDKGDNYLLRASHKCSKDMSGQNYICEQDKFNGQPGLLTGKLYVKIYDIYYSDNKGGYDLKFLSGFYFNGLISNAMKVLDRILQNSAKFIYKKVLLRLANLLRVLMTLFVILQILVFVLGMSRDTKSHLLTSLLKFTFIMFFLSESNFDFFYENFFGLFRDIPDKLADIITSASLFVNTDADSNFGLTSNLVLPRAAGYLAMFDGIFAILLSPAIHAKIWALFFSQKILWIFLLYVLLLIVMQSVILALVVFFVAIIRGALLITVSPVCIIFLLYNILGHVYQQWVKHMMVSGVAIILNTIVVAALFRIIDNGINQLFNYGMETGYLLWIIPYYKVTKWDEVEQAITIGKYINTLVAALLFSAAVRKVPSLADSLSELYFGTFSAGVSSFESAAMDGRNGQGGIIARGLYGGIDTGQLIVGKSAGGLLSLYEKRFNKNAPSLLRKVGNFAAKAYDMSNTVIHTGKSKLDAYERMFSQGRTDGLETMVQELKGEKSQIEREIKTELDKIKKEVKKDLAPRPAAANPAVDQVANPGAPVGGPAVGNQVGAQGQVGANPGARAAHPVRRASLDVRPSNPLDVVQPNNGQRRRSLNDLPPRPPAGGRDGNDGNGAGGNGGGP